MTQEIEIGRSKRGRRVYAFDDIAIVPSRRTRDPEDVSVGWSIDAYQFDIPFLAAPMDSVVSPRTAIMMGQLGGLGVLDLEGLWTRYEDPSPCSPRSATSTTSRRRRACRSSTPSRSSPTSSRARLAEIRAAGVTVAGALSPQRTQELYETVVAAGVDLFVIRGTTVSAEHVSKNQEPLNLKKFIYELDVPVIVGGAATYTAALHLMRTGAAGVLVGFGGGAASTTRATLGIHAPMATAVADVAGARRDYLDESGGRYVHVIADGGVGKSGDIVKAIAAAPTRSCSARRSRGDRRARRRLPLGRRGAPRQAAARPARAGRPGRPLEEILYGPAPAPTARQPRRRAAQVDGDHRLLRPQGVPARRGRRRAVPVGLSPLRRPPARPWHPDTRGLG